MKWLSSLIAMEWKEVFVNICGLMFFWKSLYMKRRLFTVAFKSFGQDFTLENRSVTRIYIVEKMKFVSWIYVTVCWVTLSSRILSTILQLDFQHIPIGHDHFQRKAARRYTFYNKDQQQTSHIFKVAKRKHKRKQLQAFQDHSKNNFIKLCHYQTIICDFFTYWW